MFKLELHCSLPAPEIHYINVLGHFLNFDILRAEPGKSFPDEVSDVLHFFGVRREEQASRSVYGTLVTALAFLEEAGEVPKLLRLSTSSGLVGAAKEFEAKRRLLAESLGKTTSRKQAPPLILALLEAMENVVVDESLPLYVRAYSWYRLLRHWASFRFSDTAGLPPGTLARRVRGLSGS